MLLLYKRCHYKSLIVGFEVLTVVVMKSYIFCDIMPCTGKPLFTDFQETKQFVFMNIAWTDKLWLPIHLMNKFNLQTHYVCTLGFASSLLKVNRSFRGTLPPPPSGSKNKLNMKTAWGSACYILNTSFLLGLFFNPKDGGDMFLWNISCFNELHGIISQKTELFKSLIA
jgi:hypothetical protein